MRNVRCTVRENGNTEQSKVDVAYVPVSIMKEMIRLSVTTKPKSIESIVVFITIVHPLSGNLSLAVRNRRWACMCRMLPGNCNPRKITTVAYTSDRF